jgi:hypothetical protein
MWSETPRTHAHVSRGRVWLGGLLYSAVALLVGCGQPGTMSRFMPTPDRMRITVQLEKTVLSDLLAELLPITILSPAAGCAGPSARCPSR